MTYSDHKKRNKKYRILLLAVLLIFISGCQDNSEQRAPELREPVSRNSACRPVEKGRVGRVETRMASVVPAETAHFYLSDVVLEKVEAEVGDYVRKGDILARCDNRAERERKKALEEELRQEGEKHVWQEKIVEKKKAEARLMGGKGSREKLAVLEEEARYAGELYKQQVKELEREIGQAEEEIQKGYLRAKHSGYVTYRKDPAASVQAQACENIVVVADRGQRYIELTKVTADQYAYDGYQVKYIISDGKQYPVKEAAYSENEMAAAKKAGRYPAVRFACPAGAELSCGDSCLVYFCKKDSPEVLVVGNDSLHTQGEETYVYVRDSAGGEEKRSIKTGAQDDYRTEVTEGLKEGEMVCYSSSAALPVGYGTHTVARTQYEVRSHSGSCRFADTSPHMVMAEREGKIVESAVYDGCRVKKGDLLYVIDTGKSKAALADLANQIRKEKESYRAARKELKKQAAVEMREKRGRLRELAAKRWRYERELAACAYRSNVQKLERQYEEYKKDNDGSGRIRVCARTGGRVINCQIRVGEEIPEGAYLFGITGKKDKKRLLVLQIPPLRSQPEAEKRFANVGERIALTSDGRRYSGTCTGYTEALNNVYLTTESGKTYVGKNSESSFQYPGYYVELEEGQIPSGELAKTQTTFAAVCLKDVLTVPSGSVYEEDTGKGESDWYVWRVVRGELVKQYVEMDRELCDGTKQVIFSGLEPGDVVAD